MSNSDLSKIEIIKQPEHFFSAQSKTIEARLEEIKLTSDQEAQIVASNTKRLVRDKILGCFKIGEVISTLLSWNEKIDEDTKTAKKEYLLEQYFEKNDRNEDTISALKDFLTRPQGNTLYNKVLRILDETPPDVELTSHLASALKYMVDNRFGNLFEQHKYALSQIEKLTPQALTILSGYKTWPRFRLQSFSATGTKLSSEWLSEFSTSLAVANKVSDRDTMNRINHSVNELVVDRLVEGHVVSQQDRTAECRISKIGMQIVLYICA